MKFYVSGLNSISENWTEHDVFGVVLHCEVSERGASGGEAFIVNVLSPKALELQLGGSASQPAIELGRGCLFMRNYDRASVFRWLERFVERSEAKEWSELFSLVDRHFDWIE